MDTSSSHYCWQQPTSVPHRMFQGELRKNSVQQVKIRLASPYLNSMLHCMTFEYHLVNISLSFILTYALHQRGCMHIAPSRRVTSPFNN